MRSRAPKPRVIVDRDGNVRRNSLHLGTVRRHATGWVAKAHDDAAEFTFRGTKRRGEAVDLITKFHDNELSWQSGDEQRRGTE